MLDSLPPEILEQILSYLPSAASILSLDCVNTKLHAAISANQYAVFRKFVQRAFPTISTPPIWSSMARQLTSRSRAWDRRAFLVRECYPDVNDSSGPPWLDLSSKFGYTPVIDSYDEYVGGQLNSKRNVLAFGAAGRLRLRTTQKGNVTWSSLRMPEDHLPQYDIIDLRLLKPQDHPYSEREILVIQRADKSVTRVQSTNEADEFTTSTKFLTASSKVNCMDISTGVDAQLAVFDKTSLMLFPLHGVDAETQPAYSTSLQPRFRWQNRRRCARFLTNDTIVTSVQFVQGLERAPILIYNITPSGLSTASLSPTESLSPSEKTIPGRHSATVLTKLDSAGSLANRPGQVFLSGWTDACVRLHDLRTPQESVCTYFDPVDNGKILSLATCGHEKFFAGSHQNGCLKMFDMRMPGARPYSYLDTSVGKNKQTISQAPDEPINLSLGSLNLEHTESRSRKDVNIFLTPTVNQRGRLWEPLPAQEVTEDVTRNPFESGRGSRNSRRTQRSSNHNHYARYRGSVYSLSIPSPSSTTLFAGIENHVMQLDFINTDDVRRQTIEIPTITNSDPNQSNQTTNNTPFSSASDQILSMSCYERPRPGHEATDPVLLRKQIPWSHALSNASYTNEELEEAAEHGWDERWRLGRSWKDRRQ